MLNDNLEYIGLKRGDVHSFEHLYKLYYSKAVFFANQYLRDEETSREIVQDAFMALWEKRETLNEELSIQALILTIVKNRCLNLLRKRIAERKYADRLTAREDMINYRALGDDSASSLHLMELEQLTKETLTEMPEKMREVFRMNRDEELTYAEIAQKLDVSVKTIEYRMSKALLLFREKLKDYLPVGLLILIKSMF